MEAEQRVLLVGSVATDQPDDHAVSTPASTFARVQLRGRFDMIVLGTEVLAVDDRWQRLIAHNCAAHLEPGGSLAVSASTPEFSAHAAACGFEQMAEQHPRSWWRRTERHTIHDLVADARRGLDRLSAPELASLMVGDEDVVVVDVRIPQDRRQHGAIPGAVAIGRTVLEWRADPTSGYAHDAIASFDQPIVVVCNEGYSSSLAAATLQGLGFSRATDLVGGMVAWTGAGQPVVAPPEEPEAFVPLA